MLNSIKNVVISCFREHIAATIVREDSVARGWIGTLDMNVGLERAREVSMNAWDMMFTRDMNDGYDEHESTLNAFTRVLEIVLPSEAGNVNLWSTDQQEFLILLITG